ncbi:hypothetical protein [Geodermatophilus sp. SYSU D01176]
MPAALRRWSLTVHVVTSVGWLGAVAAFLALAAAGLTGRDAATVRGAHVGAEILTEAVIVPLALASLVTGVLQSLGTPWGLLRHWWVAVKLALTVASTALLLLHTQPIGHLGELAASGAAFGADARHMQVQLLVDAAAALLALIGATALAVVKPRGLTPLGRRRA